MQNYTLKRKIVRYETVKIQANDWAEAIQQLDVFNNSDMVELSDQEIIEGDGTAEYTGDVE